jgi:thiol:disulfide interchange protein DsbD
MNLSGSPIDYIHAFLWGVGLSFTPCVYPLIPVIVGYIGIEAGTTKIRGFTLSLSYITGVATTYSALGLFASLSGRIFGEISAHPITHAFAGLIIVLFGISMFDLFNIKLPNFVKLRLLKKKNHFGAFLLGLNSGLLISPCVSPALGAILIYLSTKKNIAYAATILFTFAYGTGLVLVLAGTFSSVLVNLPRSGKWMIFVKRISALALVGVGIYFIYLGWGEYR